MGKVFLIGRVMDIYNYLHNTGCVINYWGSDWICMNCLLNIKTGDITSRRRILNTVHMLEFSHTFTEFTLETNQIINSLFK